MDESSSIGFGNFLRILDFVNKVADLVASFKGSTKYSAISFNTRYELVQPATRNLTKFKRYVSVAGYGEEGNDFNVGVIACLNQLTTVPPASVSSAPSRVLMMISDFWERPDESVTTAAKAKENGVRFVAVGIGRFVNYDFMKALSSPGYYTRIKDFKNVTSIITDISLETCSVSPPPAVPGSCKSASRLCKLRFEGVVKNPMKFVMSGSQFTTPVLQMEGGKMVKFDSSDVKTTVIFKKKTVALPDKLFTAVRGKRNTVTFELNDSVPIKPFKYMKNCLRLDVLVDGGSTECAVFRIDSR